MIPELARLAERLKQNRTAQSRELAGAGAELAGAVARRRVTPTPGARAFDTITGQPVEIISGHSENIVLQSAGERNDRSGVRETPERPDSPAAPR